MKNAISQTRHGLEQNKHPIIPARCQPQGREHERAQTDEMRRVCADTVHNEAGKRLPDAGYNEKDSHQKPELPVAKPVVVLQPRKKWSEDEMEKVRSGVGDADECDNLCVVAQLVWVIIEWHRWCRRLLPLGGRGTGSY